MPRQRNPDPYPVNSEDDFRRWFLANDQQLRDKRSVIKSWHLKKRLRVLAGYCLGLSSHFTSKLVRMLLPRRHLESCINYSTWDDGASVPALFIAIKAQNIAMTKILLDMGASLDDIQSDGFDLWPLDYLIDFSDEVRNQFLQVVFEKRGTTELFQDSSKDDRCGVGHLFAALQYSHGALNSWTPEVCSRVAEGLWKRLERGTRGSNRELLAIIYTSGKVRIDETDLSWLDSELHGDLRRRELDMLNLALRSFKVDPHLILKLPCLKLDGWSPIEPNLFELVLSELITAGLEIKDLILWIGRAMIEFVFYRPSVHSFESISSVPAVHMVQKLFYAWRQAPDFFTVLGSTLSSFIPLSLARNEWMIRLRLCIFGRDRVLYSVQHSLHSLRHCLTYYNQRNVYILWKLMGASVPKTETFAEVISYSGYLTFARLVWMFGKDCALSGISADTAWNRVDPVFTWDLFWNNNPGLKLEADTRDQRCVVALVRILLRSTSASATWFGFLKALMTAKNVSVDILLKDRMRLETIALAAFNDSIRKHPRHVDLPAKIRRMVAAEKEFEILEQFGMED